MKKLILFLLSVGFVAISCTPKASPAVTEATIPSETAVSSDPTAILKGYTIFSTKCTRCHGQKPIHKWTYQELRPVLGSMVQKAKLNTEEIGQISAYVHANCKK
jgi:cytochrome c553